MSLRIVECYGMKGAKRQSITIDLNFNLYDKVEIVAGPYREAVGPLMYLADGSPRVLHMIFPHLKSLWKILLDSLHGHKAHYLC